jgi:hypothetical protein
MLGLALGGRTYKLKFGHRGANHPVMDQRSGRIDITSQNHGFCVDMDSLDPAVVELTHVNLYDRTNEVRHRTLPAFSVSTTLRSLSAATRAISSTNLALMERGQGGVGSSALFLGGLFGTFSASWPPSRPYRDPQGPFATAGGLAPDSGHMGRAGREGPAGPRGCPST